MPWSNWPTCRVIREQIGKLFERLEAWAAVSGAQSLSGILARWYRLRSRVEVEAVFVDKFGHRSEFYEN